MKADAEMALFRVVQEKFSNEHPEAFRQFQAKIRMDRAPGKITVEVSDSGSGNYRRLTKTEWRISFRLEWDPRMKSE